MKFQRPAILDAIPPRSHAVIEASAGTGKTWTLEHLFVDRIVAGARVDEVLVVTFTEKATREMRTRVRRTLDAIVHPSPSDARVNPAEGPTWTIGPAEHQRLQEALITFDRAPITTIHGYCQRVLAEHAFRSRRPFRQELVEPRRVFGRSFRDELREVLSEASPLREVVLRVLQTTTAERLETALFPWYAEHGLPRPAFARDAFAAGLAAMADDGRLNGALDTVRKVVHRRDLAERICAQLTTLHKIGKTYRAKQNLLSALLAVDQWGQTEVVRDAPARSWLIARLAAPGLAAVAGWAESLVGVATSPFGVLIHELLPRVRERLGAEKARHGWVDFDDMLRLVHDALRGPAGPALIAAIRAQVRYALVDEFQDTDAIQWSIFRTLFVDDAADENAPRLFVIGDPKQAIYGFRNADVHTYRRARTRLEADGAPRLFLQDNYRSTPALIDAYNAIFSSGFFEGDIRYDKPVRAGDRTRALHQEDGGSPPSVCLWQVLGKEKPNIAAVRYTLADRCAKEIQAIVEGPSRLILHEGGERRALTYADIQILTRNAREAVAIAEVLRSRGIPHAFYKQDGLFETPEARDVLTVLRAIADPYDRSTRMKAWLTPFFAVPLSDLEACRDLDPRHPLAQRLHRLAALARRQEGAALLRALVEESGLARRLLFSRQGERAWTNYQHVLEVLLEESGGRRGADELAALLEAFVEGRAEPIGGEGSVQRLESERAAVQLLTMHKSKGLEAAVVFVLGGFTRGGRGDAHEPRICHREGVREAWLAPIPTEVEGRIAREAREEDERLLYVALTRAKARLYLPYFGMPPVDAALEGGQRYEPLTGPYRWLATRLQTLVGEGYVDGANVRYESLRVVDPKTEPRLSLDAVSLPSLQPDSRESVVPFAKLEEIHRGYVLTSYTRMKSHEGGYVAPVVEDSDAAEEFAADVWDAGEDDADLPGGASMGVFLHGVLEDVDYARLRESTEFETWFEAREAQKILQQHARASGVDEVHLETAARLLYRAMRTPQSIEGAELAEGFSSIEVKVAEMSFHFPVPEPSHPALGLPGPRPARRGVIRGVVDLVFELGGRTYFLDWKSDRLPSSDPRLLEAHVDANYQLQAKLYTLGIVRLLHVTSEEDFEARFGGLLYCFLRSMNAPGRGVFFQRPSFPDVVAWEAELRESDRPWGYALRVEGKTR
ncbi:MAG: UvrD-helicase domain-containing protein [Myxococcota bacterium]